MPSTEAGPKFLHLADVSPRSSLLRKWERQRHRTVHWFVEMAAESLGVFIFVFAGVCASINPRLAIIAGVAFPESLFNVGISFALGVTFAITTTASVSGAHLNPAVTISMVIFKGFSPLKAVRYITAQIFGAYVACLLIYGQYYSLIKTAEHTLIAAGTYDSTNFTPSGIAGVFALYTSGSNLGSVFLNEFVADFFVAIIIWGTLDPTNFFVSPSTAPWVVGFSYAIIINACSPVGLAANTSRDIGGRLAAITIWGTRATGNSKYDPITALTSIPATAAAAAFYELFLRDSSRVIVPSHREAMEGHQAHLEHKEEGRSHTSSLAGDDGEKDINEFHA